MKGRRGRTGEQHLPQVSAPGKPLDLPASPAFNTHPPGAGDQCPGPWARGGGMLCSRWVDPFVVSGGNVLLCDFNLLYIHTIFNYVL